MKKIKKTRKKISRRERNSKRSADISRIRTIGIILAAIILGLTFGKLFLAH